MDRRALRLLKALAGMDPVKRRLVLNRIDRRAFCGFRYEWSWRAHEGQFEPPGGWRVWLLRAGRGFGKTGPGRNGSGRGRARRRGAPDRPGRRRRSARSPR